MHLPLLYGGRSLAPNVRVPDDLYESLREIRLFLESQHQSSAPTIHDMVSVSIKGFLKEWDNPDLRNQLMSELMEQRKLSRKKMGRRKKN
jgi:hypothetical protein